jgi:hypothetical membrane protein
VNILKIIRSNFQRSTIASLGAAGWVFGTIQFFLCQLIVGLAWPTTYNWSLNNVSDLGNIHCQPWGDNARYVCSPLHNLMNASIIAEGFLIVAGLIMIKSLWRRGCLSQIARAFLVVAGLAISLAGFVPADVNENVHVVFGAFIITFVGNIGLILVGIAPAGSLARGMRALGSLLGLVGLIATWLFFGHHYLGLGMGGMERFAVYGLPVWTFFMGGYLLIKSEHNGG